MVLRFDHASNMDGGDGRLWIGDSIDLRHCLRRHHVARKTSESFHFSATGGSDLFRNIKWV